MIEAGKRQVCVHIRAVGLLPLLVACILASACVAVEPARDTGITPVVVPTKSAPSATATVAAQPDVTPEAGAPTVVASCDAPSTSDAPVPAASSRSPDETPTPEAAGASQRLQSPRDVPAPDSPQPITKRTDLVLENQLRMLLGENLDGYAVVAVDLASGRSVSLNPASVFYSASIFKVWVMYEVYYQESLSLFRLSDDLVMTSYYDAFGLGPRATRLCQHLSVQEAMEAMMSVSDNAAAVLLQDLVGAPNINASLAALGLTDSALTPEDITVTAQDMALLLEFIASGKAVSRPASEQMAALLETESFDNGLAAGVPSEAVVAHKTGNWPTARHDVGIVFGPRSTYVIAILSDNREGSYAMTAQISQLVYEAFNK